MRWIFTPTLLAITAFCFGQGSKVMFGVTGEKPGDIQWNKVRQLSGPNTDNKLLLDANQSTYFLKARTSAKTTPSFSNGSPDLSAGGSGIAALAYDEMNQRLYFAPLFREGGIRFISLADNGSQKPVTVFSDVYNYIDRAKDGEGKNITRMVIGKGNVGYAISNDGNSFIRFSTTNDAAMENLGTLVDDEKNGEVSVHTPCTAWGGDIVAAETGELYLFTIRQLVFKINPETRVTTYLGSLKGPDAQFAVNGAAVDENGNVVLCSATQPGVRWIVADMNKLEAKAVTNEKWLNATDLASSNLLFAKQSKVQLSKVNDGLANSVGIYPNPVVNGTLTIVFHSLPVGKYAVDMVTTTGTSLMLKQVEVKEKGQTMQMNTTSLAKGLYVLRVTNASKKEAFAEKVLLQ